MIGLLFPTAVLLAAGLTTLVSISKELFLFQFLWATLGAVLVVIFLFVDWRSFFNQRWLVWGLYAVSIVLLIAVYFIGPVVRNVRGWLLLGPFRFQPVELVKIALILLYAQYFSRRHLSIARVRHILTSFIYFAIPAGLVILQPDFGSALILFGLWFGFIIVSGLRRRRLILLLILFVISGFFVWNWGLENYQRERIIDTFYPERDVLGINYSVSQSKIAIGSAGTFGKGYGQGSQTQLGFLTEPATDFIFAAFVEEWGYLGGIIVICAFLALIWNILKVGSVADRNFERFICIGTAIAFSFQFFLNVGSATGIFPVVGVTFPFVSYGGSSLLTSFLLLSIINSIAIRS